MNNDQQPINLSQDVQTPHITPHITPDTASDATPGTVPAEVSGNAMGRRIAVTIVALFILAIGVSFSIKSDLGVSPINSLPYVLSRIAGWDMGIVTALLFTFYAFVQILLLRRDYKIYSLLQVVMGVLFGSFVSLTNRLLAFSVPDVYPIRLCLMAVSILLIAISLTLIIAADFMPMPPEGLMLAIQKKTNFKFHYIKIGFDSVTVTLAILFSLLFLKRLEGIREGTVLAALLVGAVAGVIKKIFGKYINALLKKEDDHAI